MSPAGDPAPVRRLGLRFGLPAAALALAIPLLALQAAPGLSVATLWPSWLAAILLLALLAGLFAGLARAARAADRDQGGFASAVFEASLDAVVIADAEGRIVGFNRCAESVFGCPAGTALGRSVGELLVPDHYRAAHEAGMARYRRDRLPRILGRRFETEGRRADGTVFPAELVLQEISLRGRHLYAATLRDLSEAKAAEAETKRQQQRLHHAEKLSALGSLLAGVAHELNNPLAVLVAQATLLREKAPTADVRARAEKLLAAAQRSARIVKSFLAMGREKPPERRRLALDGVVEAALEMTAYGLRTAGIEVTRAFDPTLPALDADPDLLAQVVANLVINAQQVLQECEKPRRLALETARDGAFIVLSVEDSGPGVPPAIAERIFEPYFTTKPLGVGTGIGLAVCRNVAEAHGGTISVEASRLGGARFVVRLPLPEVAEAADSEGVAAGQGLRILVVDDEPDVARSLADLIEIFGHRPVVVEAPEAAIARLAEESFDLVFADMRMPGMSGLELKARLAARSPALARRTVIMTGDVVLGASAIAASPGGDGLVLEKPFSAADLQAIIERARAA